MLTDLLKKIADFIGVGGAIAVLSIVLLTVGFYQFYSPPALNGTEVTGLTAVVVILIAVIRYVFRIATGRKISEDENDEPDQDE